MKQYQKITISFLAIILLLFLVLNIGLYYTWNVSGHYFHNVEVNRIYDEIQKNGYSGSIDLSNYSYVQAVEFLSANATDSEIKQFYQTHSQQMLIKTVGDETVEGYLKFIYTSNQDQKYKGVQVVVNGCFFVLSCVVFFFLFYVKRKILNPFHQIQEMPFQLAKGHLTNSLKENKNRFFGRFLWGLDMLRENLESHKKKELLLVKEKKSMVLSISHDIKTPLSAIKLYVKALQQGLYQEFEKKQELLINIDDKANEIEGYVNEIIKTSKEDFLHIEVKKGEFYLSELINRLYGYYKEKLALVKTEFIVHDYTDCILYGDLERCLEVFENLMENAIKYGDGKKIELSFSKEENCQLITVSNTGNTLPSNETVHIFDSFWRGSNAVDKQGSGLGLYICRQILSKMNGDIFATPTESQMQITAVLKMQ